MSSFEICNFEEFVAEVTPQSGSLEDAASAQEILIQQVEGYLQRMKSAMCADILTLEAQINGGGGGGGEVWKISERRADATAAIPGAGPAAPLDFEVAGINDAPLDLDWDGVAFAWENISAATLYCNVFVTIACQDAGGTGRPLFELLVDAGAGFTAPVGGRFWSQVGRMSAAKVFRIDLAPGDKIAVGGYAIAGSVNLIQHSVFQILSRTTTP
jgi:hypothetical protein